MIKIALFTEGQTELILARNLLFRVIDNSKLSFECIKLHGGREIPTRFSYAAPNPQVHFLVINAECDNKVLSAIREREEGLFQVGYEKIIGLRDMYSEIYDQKSPRTINESVSNEFIENTKKIIDYMSKPDRIIFIFAIMEIEAWFLAMYNLFKKIDAILSVEYIEEKIGINFKNIDPQKEFYKPSNEVNKIFQLIGRNYRKSESDTEMLCSQLELSDLNNATENNRCEAFRIFLQTMNEYN